MEFQDLILSLLENDTNACNAYFSVYKEPVPKTIKILNHKIQFPDFLKEANQNNWQITPTELGHSSETIDSYLISREDESQGLGKHWLHQAGFFYIQELAASLPAPILLSHIKEKNPLFLDMCSAPGGKGIQLADRLLSKKNINSKKSGLVICNEINASRTPALQYNLRRTGCYNTCITQYSGEFFGEHLPEFFDGVLVDAPCSGEGTGFKSDAGIKRRRKENAFKLAQLQKKLLDSAIRTCKPGGIIVYSTCTINPWENEMVVQYALENNTSIELLDVAIPKAAKGISQREGETILSPEHAEKVARLRPHLHNTGGFFIALFRKKPQGSTETTSTDSTSAKSIATNTPTQPSLQAISRLDMTEKLQVEIQEDLQRSFGIQINPQEYFFISSDSQVYLTSPKYKNIHGHLFTKSIGIPIYKKDKQGNLIPLHSLGHILGHIAGKNYIELNEEDTQKYSEGFDIDTKKYINQIEQLSGFHILRHQGYGISTTKLLSETLKNKFLK